MTNFVKSAKNVFLTFFSNFSYFCLKCDKNMGIRSSYLLRFTHTTAERSTDHDMISCLHVATFYDQVLLHFGGAVPKAPMVPKAPTSPIPLWHIVVISFFPTNFAYVFRI